MSVQECYVHESSYVDDGARVGRGTKIWHFSHVQSGAVVGERCSLGQNVNIADGAVVGDDCKLQNNVSIYKGVVLGRGVFCGPSCVFTNDFYPRAQSGQGWEIRETHVGDGASIGANATIVCGNSVGSFAMIGSGAVVTRDVPAYALDWWGCPPGRLGGCASAAKSLTAISPALAAGVFTNCARAPSCRVRPDGMLFADFDEILAAWVCRRAGLLQLSLQRRSLEVALRGFFLKHDPRSLNGD